MDQLGSYRLRKRLAVGGMGEVYLGEKLGPEGFVKPVVLKCVLPQLAKDRAFVQLFLDEARLAALLNHPNIAQIYDFGLVDDIYYIAMEYVPGYTVDDIRRKLKSIGQFMPLQHVANIASQVCQGLHYAHTLTDANKVSLGLVHRDVSPHNLIVSVDGSVKIVDFGIAKARAGLTRVQAKGAVGKFGYMSPEQARGESVDGRSDTFSLGVCLWELCTNGRLHDPDLDRAPEYTPTRPIASVDQIRPEVPRQFQQILDVALSIQEQDRYRTIQDMHLALERFQAAMTHYAGQAALAAYIKDLVEGRIENPEEGNRGGLVEPLGGPGANAPRVENMDGAQKYEEVFGVTMEAKRRPTLRAVPQSWQTAAPSSAVPPPVASSPRAAQPAPEASRGAPRMVDLAGDRTTPTKTPELELDRAQPAPRRPVGAAPRVSGAPQRRVPWAAVISVGALVGLGGAGYHFRARLPEVMALVSGTQEPQVVLTSKLRVTSQPEGSIVFVDGEKKGPTPLEVELIPKFEHQIMVRKAGFATVVKTVEGTAAEVPPTLAVTLVKAARLDISSVPPGASITINGRQIDDTTPVTLKDVPGGVELKVKVEIKGMKPQMRTITVKPGRRGKVRVNLVNG